MRKRAIALALAAVMAWTAACGPADTQETVLPSGTEATAEAETAGEEAAVRNTAGGAPWPDSDLKNNIAENMEVSPKEDFHLAANYEWLFNTEIPEGRENAGTFLDVELEVQENIQAALEDETVEGHEAALSRALYHAFLNWEERDALGVEPMMDMVNRIQSIKTMEELTDFICNPENNMWVPVLASYQNTADLNDASSYILSVNEDTLFLRDSAEYNNRTEYGDRCYESEKMLVSGMLQRAGYTKEEAEGLFEQAIAFEGRLAAVLLTSEEAMDPDVYQKINNVYTKEELKELCRSFPLIRMMEEGGYGGAERILVSEPDYFQMLDECYTEENLENIKAYMLTKWAGSSASELDREAFELSVASGQILSGAEGSLEDEEYAIDVVSTLLMEPLEQTYLVKYDASKKKQDITRLCQEMITVYEEMLKEQDWMSEQTKQKAIEKLKAIQINAVYPEKWYDYSSLDLEGLSYWECLGKISAFLLERDRAHTNQKIDPEEWTANILETNAYYNPQDNSITILLGILGSELYREDMTQEELCGGIGAVIGHEISHAFDTSGAQFDKDGNISNWWTQEDLELFRERAQKLITYYDSITVFEGEQVRGRNIQTEAIADMAGMKSILLLAEDIEGFDYDAMFRQYASVWKQLSSYEFEYLCLTQDTHPLHFLRTNVTLQQFDEFYETYDIQPGDTMYLAPEDRISVW